jgi:hypothetical protein
VQPAQSSGHLPFAICHQGPVLKPNHLLHRCYATWLLLSLCPLFPAPGIAAENLTLAIGYAYEVPCYIPSERLLKEGGYETESSLVFYGFYAPFRPGIDTQLIDRLERLMALVRP